MDGQTPAQAAEIGVVGRNKWFKKRSNKKPKTSRERTQ